MNSILFSVKKVLGWHFNISFLTSPKKKKTLPIMHSEVHWEQSTPWKQGRSWKPSGAVGSSLKPWELLILFLCHRSVPPSAGTEECPISARDCWRHLHSPLERDSEPGQHQGLCLRLCLRAWGIMKPFKVFVLQVCKGLPVMHRHPIENYFPLRSCQFM